MSRLRLVILDANIVIYLHQLGIWSQVVDRCEIVLARTVAEQEVLFYEVDDERHEIDLTTDVAASRVRVVDVLASEVVKFRSQFDPLYLEGLHVGETESLVHLALNPETGASVCSADKVVFRVLPHLGLTDRGISLEELLAKVGLGRSVPYMYSRAFREQWTRRGEQDWIGGIGTQRGEGGSS